MLCLVNQSVSPEIVAAVFSYAGVPCFSSRGRGFCAIPSSLHVTGRGWTGPTTPLTLERHGLSAAAAGRVGPDPGGPWQDSDAAPRLPETTAQAARVRRAGRPGPSRPRPTRSHRGGGRRPLPYRRGSAAPARPVRSAAAELRHCQARLPVRRPSPPASDRPASSGPAPRGRCPGGVGMAERPTRTGSARGRSTSGRWRSLSCLLRGAGRVYRVQCVTLHSDTIFSKSVCFS